MLCEIAIGVPSRGIRANTRRESIPSSRSTPLATGLSPWKSKSNQPSRRISASAAWMAGSVRGSSMRLLRRLAGLRGGTRLGCGRRLEGLPVRAPFTGAFTASGAAYVINGPDAADHETQELAQHRLVIRAADARRGRVQRDGARHFEVDMPADAAHRPVCVSPGDRAH